MRACDRPRWTWTAQWDHGSSQTGGTLQTGAMRQRTRTSSPAGPPLGTPPPTAIPATPRRLPGSRSQSPPPTAASAWISQIPPPPATTAAASCPGPMQVSVSLVFLPAVTLHRQQKCACLGEQAMSAVRCELIRARLRCMSTPTQPPCPSARQQPASRQSHRQLQTPLLFNPISLPLLPAPLPIPHAPCPDSQFPIVNAPARSVQCPCRLPLPPPPHAQN